MFAFVVFLFVASLAAYAFHAKPMHVPIGLFYFVAIGFLLKAYSWFKGKHG